MRDGGKGDMQRPLVVPVDKFEAAWDQIFNNKDIKEAIDETIEQYNNHETECGK